MQKIIVQFDFPEVTLQQYDQVWDELKAAGNDRPAGLLFHAAAPKPGGGIVIVDVWASAEALKEFGIILAPIVQKQPGFNTEPKIYPVHAMFENIPDRSEPLK